MGFMKTAMIDMVNMGMKPTNENLKKYVLIKQKAAEKNGASIKEEIKKNKVSKVDKRS
tara:strand:+ start:475 stop:648 length:174 start_codon:yes stop_codon:yes gene_type:complete